MNWYLANNGIAIHSENLDTELADENSEWYGLDDEGLNKFANMYQNTNTNIGQQNEQENDTDNQNSPTFENLCIDQFQYHTINNFNEKFCEEHLSENDLKVLNINIRGISKNYDNLTAYLSSIKLKFHVIVLSECHISKDELNLDIQNRYPLTGYKMYHVKSTRKYGGVIIYVTESLNVSYVNELTVTNDICDSLYLNLIINNINIVIAGYYRHCIATIAEKIRFINFLDDQLKNKKVANKKIVLAGDFNICLMRSCQNSESLMYLNTLIENGLLCHIFKPTRIMHYKNSLQVKSATLIDQICSNFYEYKCISGNLIYDNSDHFPNFLIVKNIIEANKQTAKKQHFRRNFKKINSEALENDLDNINWTDLVQTENNIEKCFENIK